MGTRVNRRQFAHSVGATSLATAFVVRMSDAAGGEPAAIGDNATRGACHFQSSYMTWDLPPRVDPRPYARHKTPFGNLARIELEALIDVIDVESGKSDRFVLIAPCRTEWVYAEDRLFQLPSAEYRQIYSLTEERGMGGGIKYSGRRTRGHPVAASFRSLKIDVQTYPRSRVLRTDAEIVKATAGNLPLVGRTQLVHPNGRWRYALEYPIRTMNFQPKTNSFQVDTGPLLVPDFDAQQPRPIDALDMAHVAYNRLDRAEFIRRRPTPILDGKDRELAKVLHYSDAKEMKSQNQILAGEFVAT